MEKALDRLRCKFYRIVGVDLIDSLFSHELGLNVAIGLPSQSAMTAISPIETSVISTLPRARLGVVVELVDNGAEVVGDVDEFAGHAS